VHPIVELSLLPTPNMASLQGLNDLGDLLKQFSVGACNTTDAIKLSEVEPVASYSWINERAPTIAVPGMW
jgi:hypothetical protein